MNANEKLSVAICFGSSPKLTGLYGNRWRFDFNAGKSAVMVFGEDRKVNNINKTHRVFRLGQNGVKERDTYDHVGVKMGIFRDSTERIEEKISKGRKALNASTGLGIRKNGLTMGTCNCIFWQVVVPMVTFGSEDNELLLTFQRYAGKRVQRFPYRTPNFSSFYGIGWLKLTTYIKVKKMLFVLTILNMESDFIIREIFESRLVKFCDNVHVSRKNVFSSSSLTY